MNETFDEVTSSKILDQLKQSYSLTSILDEIKVERTVPTYRSFGIAPTTQGWEPLYLREASDSLLIAARVHSISAAVIHTLLRNQKEVFEAKLLISEWIQGKAAVRILGAGRALLAGAMPGNRLAHAGAQVSFMGGMVPLPNSDFGGGIIACSASGKTKPVMEAMAIAKDHNPHIKTIGIADYKAEDFKRLCDVFIGLHLPKEEYPNPLSALADTEECMITEILDGLVVLAGQHNGFDDEAWRRGHENIGPTGPYAPRGQSQSRAGDARSLDEQPEGEESK